MKFPTIDCHVHLHGEEDLARFQQLAPGLNVSGMALLAYALPGGGNHNAMVLAAKSRRPDFFRAFVGLDHAALVSGGRLRAPSLAEQARRLAAAGADGFKLLENKPTTRKWLKQPADGEYLAEFFAEAERLGLPLLWHVADPEEFWDESRTPKWAKDRGWGYDASFEKKEMLAAETERVLERHPKLKVIFPHFYFLSADLDRAERLLEEHPGMHLDLAPGIELFYNLSRDRDRAREFFIRRSRRILFGTDTGMTADLSEATCKARINLVARFLETAEEFRLPPEADFLLGPPEDGVIRGLELPEASLRLICRENFERLAGRAPRPLDRALAANECRRLAGVLAGAGDAARAAVAERTAGELGGA